MIGSRAVSQNLLFGNLIAFKDDRTLVNTGTLVGTFEFQQRIYIHFTVFCTYTDFVAYYADNFAGTFSQNADTGVRSNLVFHTGTDNRSLSAEQRYSLTLHVRTHQSTVSVIVLQERNQRGCDRYYLFRRNVHQVNLIRSNGEDIILSTGGNTLAQEVAVIIQRFVGLCYDIFIFFVRSHVSDFFSYTFIFFINNTVRSFHKAIFIDNSIGGQRTDQTDVRTFRRLDRTHTTIVGVVYVADFIACALTGQTAGAEGRQTTFMSQLCQRVVLIHELGQLAAAEEFLNSGNNRTDVNQSLRGNNFVVLNGHTFFYYTLHTGKTDTELVLQQFANAAYTTVAQMVNIIAGAMAIHQVQQIVEGSKYILIGNGMHFFIDTGGEHQKHFFFMVLNLDSTQTTFVINAAFCNLIKIFIGHLSACRQDDFAGFFVSNSLSQYGTAQAVAPAKLFVELITAYISQIITLAVKEGVFNQLYGVFQNNRLARTQLLVKLQHSFISVSGSILFQSCQQCGMVAEASQDLIIGRQAQSTQQHGCRNLTGTVYTSRNNIIDVSFIFNPSATVRNYSSTVNLLTAGIHSYTIVNAGRTHQLADNNTFSTVDNKGAGISHQRKVTHKYRGFLNFAFFLVFENQACFYVHRCRIGFISLLALFNAVFRSS